MQHLQLWELGQTVQHAEHILEGPPVVHDPALHEALHVAHLQGVPEGLAGLPTFTSISSPSRLQASEGESPSTISRTEISRAVDELLPYHLVEPQQRSSPLDMM